jgi:aminoglycoside phosphotransferase family enzyme
MAALALDLSSVERRRWGNAVLQAYSDALEDTDALVLELSPARGRA